MVPRSLYLAAAAIAGYAILAIPGIGFIVAIFGGLFIPPILLNLAVVGTAIEAGTGNVGRSWWLLPLLWFGGFAILGLVDRWEIHRLSQQVEAHNAAVKLAFDPVTETLVFDDSGAAMSAIRQYAVPTVFAQANGRTFAYRIGDRAECDKLRGTHNNSVSMSGLLDPGSKQFGGRLVEGHCIIREARPVGLPAYRISSGETSEKSASGASRVSLREIRITAPGGQVYVLKDGSAQPMGFIPFPMFGCGPNGGGSSTCEGMMGFPKHKALLKRDPVGAALGLRKVDWSKVEDELAAASAPPSPQQVESELVLLDRMIADPAGNNQEASFSALRKAPESFAGRAEALTGAIEASYGDPAAWSSGQSLVSLATALPDRQWQMAGPRLLRLYQRSNWHWLRKDEALLARFGDLGEPAVATLLEAYDDRKAAGLTGLCRAGDAARATAGPVLLQNVANPSSRLVNARAEIITLARMGLYQEAMAANDRRGRFKIPPQLFDDLPARPGREWCDRLSIRPRRRS